MITFSSPNKSFKLTIQKMYDGLSILNENWHVLILQSDGCFYEVIERSSELSILLLKAEHMSYILGLDRQAE